MTDADQVKAIVEKCNNSLSDLSDNATAKEFKTVLKTIASQSNKGQRQLVGLED